MCTAGPRHVSAAGADQLAVPRLALLPPPRMRPQEPSGLRARRGGRGAAGSARGGAPLRLPPRPAAAGLGQRRPTPACARAARRPARPGGTDRGGASGPAGGRSVCDLERWGGRIYPPAQQSVGEPAPGPVGRGQHAAGDHPRRRDRQAPLAARVPRLLAAPGQGPLRPHTAGGPVPDRGAATARPRAR